MFTANNKIFKFVAIVISVTLLLGGISFLLAQNYPEFFSFVKLPRGLTPARDLTGTWISSLSGKGCQLMGRFELPGSTSTIYENGDIELIISDVSDNIASGTIRYYNLCGHGLTTVPGYGTIQVPETCIADSGPIPLQITVSSSHLDFGTINGDGINATMTGNFTTDLISGTMTFKMQGYGDINGTFNLIRKR